MGILLYYTHTLAFDAYITGLHCTEVKRGAKKSPTQVHQKANLGKKLSLHLSLQGRETESGEKSET